MSYFFRLFLFPLLFVLFAGCYYLTLPYSSDREAVQQVQIIAHRGAPTFAPENTLPAIRKALEIGVDMIEIDVHQTKDGVLVLMHDEKVDKTTDGRGYIKDMTFDEIRLLDAGSWFDPVFTGTKVPAMRVDWPYWNRPAIQSEPIVRPQQLATFTFKVAGAAPGTYRLNLRPVVDGVVWLEDEGVYVDIRVE